MHQPSEHEILLTRALDLGEQMLRRGAEVGRVEDTLTRILRSQGAVRVDVFTITSSMVVTAQWADGPVTQTRRISGIHYDMTALTRLNALSREICAGACSIETMGQRLEKIARGKTYGSDGLCTYDRAVACKGAAQVSGAQNCHLAAA